MKNQTNETHAFLTFSLGAEKFAISVDSVQEIVELEQVTKVPNAPLIYAGHYQPARQSVTLARHTAQAWLIES